jgi:hypothetical protein
MSPISRSALARCRHVVAALALTAGCERALPTAPSRAVSSRPLASAARIAHRVQGSCETTFAPTGAPAPNQVSFAVDGTCIVSGLGRTAVHIDQTATFALDGTSIVEGTMTLTAANGDRLVLHSVADGDPVANGVITFDGVGDVVAGTGRFADASGRLTITDGFANFATLAGGFALDGIITR